MHESKFEELQKIVFVYFEELRESNVLVDGKSIGKFIHIRYKAMKILPGFDYDFRHK